MNKRAVILAAGVGQRLGLPADAPAPKCLLRFGGMTLLERHLRLLHAVGVTDITIVVGYEQQQIADEIARLEWTPAPALRFNPDYRSGSTVSVAAAADTLRSGDDILLMDADVLYDRRMLWALVSDTISPTTPDTKAADGVAPPTAVSSPSRGVDRLLLDRDFEAGEEPVKLCLRSSRPVELRKRVDPGVSFDTVGESVGFFRFSPVNAARLADIVEQYVRDGRGVEPHEEAVRDLLLAWPDYFETADVTGLPWLEIDFPADVARARDAVLPYLEPL